jgi:hypothetical protein
MVAWVSSLLPFPTRPNDTLDEGDKNLGAVQLFSYAGLSKCLVFLKLLSSPLNPHTRAATDADADAPEEFAVDPNAQRKVLFLFYTLALPFCQVLCVRTRWNRRCTLKCSANTPSSKPNWTKKELAQEFADLKGLRRSVDGVGEVENDKAA